MNIIEISPLQLALCLAFVVVAGVGSLLFQAEVGERS